LTERRTYRADGALELTDGFTWDDADILSGWSTNNASGILQYDNADRLLSQTVTIGATSLSRQYTWHANDNVASITGPDGVTLQYTYDGYDGLARVDIPGEGSISVTA